MTEPPVFGSPNPQAQSTERRAAYVVVIRDGKVAMVNSTKRHFLPGGGSLARESPEETIAREVREELALHVRLLRKLGDVIQYFYSTDDDRHYRMTAAFFAGEFTDEACSEIAEHQLDWLPIAQVEQSCFHECHAWAVRQLSRESSA